MVKKFRMIGIIGKAILTLAIVTSGCMSLAIDASGDDTVGNTPGIVIPSGEIEVTEASSDGVGENIPSSVMPFAAVEVKDARGDGTVGNAAGGFMPAGATEGIADWCGVIKSTGPGAQYDDYFERQNLGQAIYFSIDSLDPAIQAQIVALCDSGKIVHLYGTLFSNVLDYNGSQIQVDRIEVEE